uniref:Uncharacterized protein n=1 Tax=Ixodes ricinus TaxID=34613 RepID=A0A6B0UDE1_IXORI
MLAGALCASAFLPLLSTRFSLSFFGCLCLGTIMSAIAMLIAALCFGLALLVDARGFNGALGFPFPFGGSLEVVSTGSGFLGSPKRRRGTDDPSGG